MAVKRNCSWDILGYGFGQAGVCHSASKIKQSQSQHEDERLCLCWETRSIFIRLSLQQRPYIKLFPKDPLQTTGRPDGIGPGSS